MTTHRKNLGVCCLIVLVGLIAYLVWYGLAFVGSTVKPRYAVEWTTVLIAEHLEANDGEWPTQWEDLEDDFGRRGADRYPFSFTELQTLVDVRWDIRFPRDRELFEDEEIRVIRIPESNDFRRSLEPDVGRRNRELRDYVVGEPSQWLLDNLKTD